MSGQSLAGVFSTRALAPLHPRAYLHFCPWHLQSSCIEPNPHRQSPMGGKVGFHPSIRPPNQPTNQPTWTVSQPASNNQPARSQSNLGQACEGQGSANARQAREGSLQPAARGGSGNDR